MTIDLTEDMAIDQEITELRELSQDVENYIGSQAYLSNYGPDGYTEQDLLIDCYTIITYDLTDMGIEFDDDMFEDGYLMRFMYDYRKFFDGDRLVKLLKEHKDWIPSFQNLLDTEDTENDLISDILDFLIEAAPEDHAVNRIYEMYGRVYSMDAFADHIQAIITEASVLNSLITDVDTVRRYIEFIEVGRTEAITAAKTLYEYHLLLEERTAMIQHTSWDQVEPYLNTYDLDKVSVDEVSLYCYVDDDFALNIPDQLKDIAEKAMLKHHERSPHHIECWISIAKKAYPDGDMLLPIPTKALIVLVAHHWHPGMSKSGILKKVIEMNKKASGYINETCLNYTLALCEAFV
jgi:hypothetical protein